MSIFRVPVSVSFPQAGGPAMNVLHVRTADVDTAEEIGNALDALEAFYTAIQIYFPQYAQIRLGEGMVQDVLGSPVYYPDDLRVINSSSSLPPAATLLAVVVSWRTVSATRSGRGRTFIGPIQTNAIDGDATPSAALISALNTAAGNLVSASTGAGGWSLCVLSQKEHLARDVTGHRVRDRWGVLRSRRD